MLVLGGSLEDWNGGFGGSLFGRFRVQEIRGLEGSGLGGFRVWSLQGWATARLDKGGKLGGKLGGSLGSTQGGKRSQEGARPY